jgi:Domain of unknown function (DUF4439)
MNTYPPRPTPIWRLTRPARPSITPLRLHMGLNALDAPQAALAAEHAAVWVYGLAGAFVPDGLASQLSEAGVEHRARRDATERMLIDAGAQPVPAEPGYLLPEPVTDTASALRLAITAETDAAAAWCSVVERGPTDPVWRAAAVEALSRATVRAVRWRATAGITPPTVPFPGMP